MKNKGSFRGKALRIDLLPTQFKRKAVKRTNSKPYRRQLCTTTYLCDNLGCGEFVALFPEYTGKTIIMVANKFISFSRPEVGQWLELHGKM